MKTPRELLLSRHRAAEKKLDAIREQVVRQSALASRETGERAAIVSPPFRRDPPLYPPVSMLIRNWLDRLGSLRWHLAGLAAMWLLIGATKVATPGGGAAAEAKAASPLPEQLMAMAEKRKLLAELADSPAPPPAETPKSFAPRPRSECPMNRVTV